MFLWGVATSAYQLEGAGENDWTQWERRERLRGHNIRCGEATGHAQRWRSDLSLLSTIGANAYRYSIEWSRIEPRPGEFNETALEQERERADYLRRLGIEPVVTLHHYTHPIWFWRKGGWENPESIAWFRRLAQRIGAELPGVRTWVTLNEPIVFLLGGYLGGLIPPGQKSFTAASRALENLLRAHAEAAAALAERPSGGRAGIAHNLLDFAPDRPESRLDRRLVAAGDALYNRPCSKPSRRGRCDGRFPGRAVPPSPSRTCRRRQATWASTTTAASICGSEGFSAPVGQFF